MALESTSLTAAEGFLQQYLPDPNLILVSGGQMGGYSAMTMPRVIELYSTETGLLAQEDHATNKYPFTLILFTCP